MAYVCAIDTGGTFTDCVLLGDDGERVQVKAPSTPDDFSRGVFDAIGAAAGQVERKLDELLPDIGHLLVGTTVGTNAVVQRRGARVGMIATRGHGDVLRIMRGHGRVAGRPVAEALAPFKTDKPEPLVTRARTVEVDERIDSLGEVVVELRREQVEAAVARLREEGVESVAVCLLWSFLNPAHERSAREAVTRLAPDLFVTTSSEVAARWGEYERWTAGALNGYLGPLIARYLDGIEARLDELGYRGRTLLMTCSGGALPVEEAKRLPLLLLGSGPVGGIAGCLHLARALGHRNIIATDMGGTSFDVGLVHDQEPVRSTTCTVAGYEYYATEVEVRSIGSGGGSIATVDPATGTIRVGPESAGAHPGPACYGRGGTAATVTDANVVLGFLDPAFFLGGEMDLDAEAAERAVAGVAEQLELSLEDTAGGIVRIVESHMADLLRRTTIEKGFHPRDFTLYSYGGAGGIHASSLARQLGVSSVVVPLADAASVWSAFGIASTDVLHVLTRTQILQAPFPPGAVNEHLEQLETEARQRLARDGFDPADVELRRLASMRYSLQVHELTVGLPDGTLDGEALDEALRAFELAYEQRYGRGSGYREAGFELVSLTVEAVGRLATPPLRERERRPRSPTGRERPVWWSKVGGYVSTPALTLSDLADGEAVEGPAVVRLPSTTVAVGPGDRCRHDELGNLLLEVA